MTAQGAHPVGRDGKALHTYCWGPDVKGREHDHPVGVPMREARQCLYCDLFDLLGRQTRKPKAGR